MTLTEVTDDDLRKMGVPSWTLRQFKPKVFVEYRGERMHLAGACRLAGVIKSVPVAYMRIFKYGWSVEEAVETPVGGRVKNSAVSRVSDNILTNLWCSKLPDKILADRLGCTQPVMRYKAKKLGLPSRRLIWARQEGYGQ